MCSFYSACLCKKRVVHQTHISHVQHRRKSKIFFSHIPHVLERNGVGQDDFQIPFCLRVAPVALVLKVPAPFRHPVDQLFDRAAERLGVVEGRLCRVGSSRFLLSLSLYVRKRVFQHFPPPPPHKPYFFSCAHRAQRTRDRNIWRDSQNDIKNKTEQLTRSSGA